MGLDAYRDGGGDAKGRLEPLRRRAAARFEDLAPLLRWVPDGLRREMAEARLAAEQPVEGISTAASAEQALRAYGAAVEAGRVAALRARSLAWRRRAGAIIAGLVAASIWGGSSALADVADTGDICRRYPDCWHKGRCSSTLPYALLGDRATIAFPRCEARTAMDCIQSCKLSGRCVPRDGQCVPRGSEDCTRSDKCEEYGWCTNIGDRCAAGGDDQCQASRVCRQRGDCSLVWYHGEPYCGVGSDTDCAELCRQHGQCARKVDRHGYPSCVARDDEDCAHSVDCAAHGHCTARSGMCF